MREECARSFGGSLLIYRELAQIFKGRLEPSHGGSDLIPFIRRREKETERLHVSWLALNVKIAHAIISDEKVGTEWICFNIADMGYHIRRDGVEGGQQTSLLVLTQWKGPDRCAFVCVTPCEGEADCGSVRVRACADLRL